MKRMVLAFLVVLSLVSTGLVSSMGLGAAQAPVPTVKIGAWNIEWLGSPDMRSGPSHGVAQSADDIADYLTASRVDVLALEEIDDNGGPASPGTNATVTAALQKVNDKTGSEWKYVLYPKDSPSDRTQHVGLAWNAKRVTQVGAPFKIPVPNQVDGIGIWNRHPHATKLSFGAGKTDVVLVTVHMKANVGGVQQARKKRELEAKALMDAMDGVRAQFSDMDILILGDTNMLKTDEPAGQIFAHAGFTDLNFLDVPTTWHGPASFDRFIVANHPVHNREFEQSALEIFNDAYLEPKGLTRLQFKRNYSDHFMVTTTIRVMDDDD